MATDEDVIAYLGFRGPLIDIFLACRRGAIGTAVADTAAAKRTTVESITAEELALVSDRCVRWGYKGHWQDAMLLHRLVMTCCLADTRRFALSMATLVPEHLRVATSALWNTADHQVYTRARGIGEQAWFAADDPVVRNEIAYEMGVLHLDPYVASRTAGDVRRWWAAAAKDPERELVNAMPTPLGTLKRWWAAMVADLSQRERTDCMPTPRKALKISKQWLLRSLDGSQGIERLQSLKALIQVAMSLPLLKEKPNLKLARELLPEALALMALVPYRTDITSYLKSIAHALNLEVPADSTASIDDVDWDARIELQGIDLVANNIVAILRSKTADEREQALALVRKVESIFESYASEHARIEFHHLAIRLILGQPRPLPSTTAAMQSALHAIEHGAYAAARSQAIEEVLGWISALIEREREAEAVELLVTLCKAAPDFCQSASSTIDFFKANLDISAAVNCLRAKEVNEAVTLYYSAWASLHRRRYFRLGLEMLSRIADLLPAANETTVNVVCELIREQPTPWVEGIDVDWHNAISALATAAVGPIERSPTASNWFAVCRLAKGPDYADQVLSNAAYDWKSDDNAVSLLASVEEVDRSLPRGRPTNADGLFEFLLTATQSLPLSGAGSRLRSVMTIWRAAWTCMCAAALSQSRREARSASPSTPSRRCYLPTRCCWIHYSYQI